MIYLDNSSTTRLRKEALEEMLPYLKEKFGNPSNIHSPGKEAKDALTLARERLSGMVNCSPSELVFTSSGTEANNLAIKGMAAASQHRGRHIVVSAVEHLSVQHPAMNLKRLGFEVSMARCDSTGRVSREEVERVIKDDTVLIAVQHANHEVGTIQPLREILEIAEERDIALHVDATASAGVYPVDMGELGASTLSLSAHKFNGPKGAGALFIAQGTRLVPQIEGGIQESGMRAGTEDVPAIVGMGKAAELASREMEEKLRRYSKLRNEFISMLEGTVPGIKVNGHTSEVLPSYLHISLPDVEGEVVAAELNERGIIVSSGSPCISRAAKVSHVLEAMALPSSLAKGSLLFAFGWETSKRELKEVAGVLRDVWEKVKA